MSIAAALMTTASGCGTPRYEAPLACSLPTELVTDIMGTDRFVIQHAELSATGGQRFEHLPFSDRSWKGNDGCRVDVRDVSASLWDRSKKGSQHEGPTADPSDILTAVETVAREATCYVSRPR